MNNMNENETINTIPEGPQPDNNVFVNDAQTGSSFIVDDTIPNSTFPDGTQPVVSTKSQKKPKEVNLLIPFFIVIALVLVVGVTGVAAFIFKDKFTNAVKKATSSPVEYYHSVEKGNFKESLDTYMGTYKKSYELLTSDSLGSAASLKVELADDISALIASTYPQLTGLKSAEVAFDGGFEADSFSFNLGAKINDADIISGNIFMDMAASKFYAQVPAISESYLDLSSELSGDEFTQISTMMTSMTDMMSSLYPEPDTMKSWAETYFNLIVDSTKNVTKEDTTVKANGIEEKATALTVTMSGSDLYDMLYKLLDTMEKDEALLKYFTDYLSVLESMDTSVAIPADDFTKTIRDAKVSLEDVKEDFVAYTKPVTMVVYVNNDGDIIGRELVISDETADTVDTATTYTITSKKATAGNDMGYELVVKDATETYFSIMGNGSASLSNFEGEFVATIPSADIEITAKVENGNIENYLSGDFKCDVTITTDYAMLSAYQLKLSIDTTLMETKFSVEAGGTDMNFGKISLVASASKEVTSRKPADSATLVDIADQTALATYISDFDPETFINNAAASAGLSITYSDLISLFSSSMSTGSYGDYEDSDFGSYDYDVYGFDMDDAESYEFDMDNSESYEFDMDDAESYEFNMDDSESYEFDMDDAEAYEFNY